MLSEASWALSWRSVGSSWPLLEHLGAKMANKKGKMATKSAKMNQERLKIAKLIRKKDPTPLGMVAGGSTRARATDPVETLS